MARGPVDTAIARAAPKPAPALTPRMSELTNGFWNMAWKAVPLIARLAPTASARIARGSRTSNTMTSTTGSQVGSIGRIFDSSVNAIVEGGMG